MLTASAMESKIEEAISQAGRTKEQFTYEVEMAKDKAIQEVKLSSIIRWIPDTAVLIALIVAIVKHLI